MTEPNSYPKGDLRRMLLVLGAIDATPEATLVKIVAKTGHVSEDTGKQFYSQTVLKDGESII